MALDIPLIREKLAHLAVRDPNLKVFGSIGHHYQLQPCATEKEVAGFEKQFSIQLPGDFREFLIRLGNGGAGPYYGVRGLEAIRDHVLSCDWQSVSAPFPYRDRWIGPNQLMREIEEEDYDDDDRRCDLVDEYWRIATSDGALTICDYGCNLRFLLIVSGEEYGNIWFDEVADLRGYSPVTLSRESPELIRHSWWFSGSGGPVVGRTTFSEWYRAWLDSACRTVE
jgi:hypothetical protein